MRTLKTLHRDRIAKREVALAARQIQSGDNMDFGLLCWERGRALEALKAEAIRAEIRERLWVLVERGTLDLVSHARVIGLVNDMSNRARLARVEYPAGSV